MSLWRDVLKSAIVYFLPYALAYRGGQFFVKMVVLGPNPKVMFKRILPLV